MPSLWTGFPRPGEIYLPGVPASGNVVGSIAGNILTPVNTPSYQQAFGVPASDSANFRWNTNDSFDAAGAGVHDFDDVAFAALVIGASPQDPSFNWDILGKREAAGNQYGYNLFQLGSGDNRLSLRMNGPNGLVWIHSGVIPNDSSPFWALFGISEIEALCYLDSLLGNATPAAKSGCGSLTNTAIFALGSHFVNACDIDLAAVLLWSHADAEYVLANRALLPTWWAWASKVSDWFAPDPRYFPYRPEVPTTQTLQYRTDIMKAYDGTEHRQALLSKPRMVLEYNALLEDDEIRRIRADLFNDLEELWHVPLWHEPFELTAAVSVGDKSIAGNFHDCDIVASEFIYLDREDGSVGEIVEVAGVTSTLIILVEPTIGEYELNAYVYPVVSSYIREGQGFARAPVGLTEFPLKADVAEFHALGGAGAAIDMYESTILLNRRPLNESAVEEIFKKYIERIDYGGVINQVTGMTFAGIGGGRRFLINTREELQFWKLFLDTIVGRREPFFFSTWRDDLVLFEQPTPGASTIRVLDDPDYETEWDPSDAHKDLQLETTDGIIQRRVQSVALGASDTLVITFTGALPGGSWTASRVSFLEQSHLGSDTVVLTHLGQFSMIDLSAVTAPQ